MAGVFKSIDQSDLRITPFRTYKLWQDQVGVETFTGGNASFGNLELDIVGYNQLNTPAGCIRGLQLGAAKDLVYESVGQNSPFLVKRVPSQDYIVAEKFDFPADLSWRADNLYGDSTQPLKAAPWSGSTFLGWSVGADIYTPNYDDLPSYFTYTMASSNYAYTHEFGKAGSNYYIVAGGPAGQHLLQIINPITGAPKTPATSSLTFFPSISTDVVAINMYNNLDRLVVVAGSTGNPYIYIYTVTTSGNLVVLNPIGNYAAPLQQEAPIKKIVVKDDIAYIVYDILGRGYGEVETFAISGNSGVGQYYTNIVDIFVNYEVCSTDSTTYKNNQKVYAMTRDGFLLCNCSVDNQTENLSYESTIDCRQYVGVDRYVNVVTPLNNNQVNPKVHVIASGYKSYGTSTSLSDTTSFVIDTATGEINNVLHLGATKGNLVVASTNSNIFATEGDFRPIYGGPSGAQLTFRNVNNESGGTHQYTTWYKFDM